MIAEVQVADRDAIRNEAIRRRIAVEDDLRELLTVGCQRQRQTDLAALHQSRQGIAFPVEVEIRNIRRIVCNIGILAALCAVAIGLNVIGRRCQNCQLPVLEHGALRGGFANVNEGDLLELDILCIPIALILRQDHAVVLDILRHRERPAPDMRTEVGIVHVPGSLNDVQTNRCHPGAADLGKELRSRCFERNFQRGVVQRLDRQRLLGRFNLFVRSLRGIERIELCTADDVIDEGCKIEAVARVSQTTEGIYKVLRRDLYTVAPVVFTQMERPDKTVVRGFPAFCTCGQIRLGVVFIHRRANQAFQHMRLNLDFLGSVVLIIVEGIKVAGGPGNLNRLFCSGSLLRSSLAGCFRIRLRCLGCGICRCLAAAACQHAQKHDAGQQKRENTFFHCLSSFLTCNSGLPELLGQNIESGSSSLRHSCSISFSVCSSSRARMASINWR